MEKRFLEQTAIFLSVVKWVVLATIIGIVVGAASAFFLKLLDYSTRFTGHYSWFFLLLPVALFVSAIMVKYWAPDAEGHGTEKVIEAVHRRSGKIKAAVVPVKLLATIVTLATGGSAGKEGPCAQIGAGISSIFADLFKFDKQDRKRLVICGISAGFASVFGTPIAGAIFGVEVLFVGNILYEVLLPSFIAGITGYHVATSLGITYFSHATNFLPVFSESFFLKVLLAGVFFGMCSFLFVEFLHFTGKGAKSLRMSEPVRALIGGFVLVVLALLFSTKFLGLGLDTIQGSLQGAQIVWYAFLLKMLFTSITLSFGGSGGIVTPLFFVGTTAGVVYANIIHADPATFAAIGLVSLLAGAANTPIAASIMAVELFGPAIAPYAAIACVISFLMTGHRSVYPSQMLAMRKSRYVDVEVGKVIEQVNARVPKRRKGWLGFYGRTKRSMRKRGLLR